MQFLFGATGGGGGAVNSVNGGVAITIDNTDPANPAVNLKYSVLDPNIGIDGGNQLYFKGDSTTIRQFSTVPGFFITDALDYLATHYVDNIVPGPGITIDDTDPVNPIISVNIASNGGLEFFSGTMLRVVTDTTTIAINGSGALEFIGSSDDVGNDSAVSGTTVTDALNTLQTAIFSIAPDFEDVLGNGNVTTLTAVFDTGGGSQTQISANQILIGASAATVSLDATGVLYSSNNGSGGGERRTSIQFDTITITNGITTRVEIDSTSSVFSGPGGETITLDPTVPQITIAAGGGFAQIGSDTFLYSDGGGTFLKLQPGVINDNAGGLGIDFGGTTGIINFPNAGFQFNGPDAKLENNGSGMTMTVKGGTNLFITDGINTAGIKTDKGNATGSGVWRLGQVAVAASVLDSTQYIEVDIDGTLYKLCLAV